LSLSPFVSTHPALAMSSKHTYKPTGPFAPQYIQGVYAPSAILIVGAALVNKTLVPVAIAIAAALAGYQFFNNREYIFVTI
jgi:cytochrome-b5 reductase